MTFAPVDICFLLVILIFAVSALLKGLVREFFSKASVVGALAAAIFFTPKLDSYVSDSIHNEILSKVVSFLLIFVVVFLVVCIIQQVVAKLFSGEIMRGLDRALGLLLGIVEGLVVVAFAIVVMQIQPWLPAEQIFEGSLFYAALSSVIRAPADYLKGMAV